ncbi:MAG: transcriptional regulator [Flavobacteriaceae bacterium]|nr:MAG: transcriptional regulator [Flavobacteriaceae bacterium]
MNSNIAIGVDVGGSHIISAAVYLNTLKIVPNSTFSAKINNKAAKDIVLAGWSQVINKTMHSVRDLKLNPKIGFAMPGPCNYKKGITLFETNDKYEELFNVSIPEELIQYLDTSTVDFRFMNDATSFGVGVSSLGDAKEAKKVIALTLGTGFGSTFINDGLPVVIAEDVPEGGCLWDKPFKRSVADDYFSTRWFVKRYFELTGKEVNGVKELVVDYDAFSKQLFREFATNLVSFLAPYIKEYKPELIILGGNISNASCYFLEEVEAGFKEQNLEVKFHVSSLGEEAAIIGSAQLFDASFWDKVKNDLPES